MDIISSEKVTDVAFEYGYETLGGFNKAFLREFGCLPHEYKKRKRCAITLTIKEKLRTEINRYGASLSFVSANQRYGKNVPPNNYFK